MMLDCVEKEGETCLPGKGVSGTCRETASALRQITGSDKSSAGVTHYWNPDTWTSTNILYAVLQDDRKCFSGIRSDNCALCWWKCVVETEVRTSSIKVGYASCAAAVRRTSKHYIKVPVNGPRPDLLGIDVLSPGAPSRTVVYFLTNVAGGFPATSIGGRRARK
jgi:hypothetical protein